jgi:hypothetical protein
MHKQRDFVAPGPDAIPAPLIKYGPYELATAIALFAMAASDYLYFPKAVVDGIISYLFKGKPELSLLLATSYRPIRCTSILGKIVEHLPASSVFPPHSMMQDALPPEQFAGRRGHSAEQLALILHCITYLRHDKPTFVLLLDLSKAFDRVWREALFVKLTREDLDPRAAAELAALYRTLRSKVKCGANLSEFIKASLGIGQGSPNSTHLFAFLLSDLPDKLREQGLGIEVVGLFIACLLFLDDIAILLDSPDQVFRAFRVLHTFAERWGLKFNLSKCAVLCYNFGDYPPQAWPFGDGVVRTSTLEKYLTNTISTDQSPLQHISVKLKKAKKASGLLCQLGLLGGAQTAATSSLLAQTYIWSVLDSGRTLADLHLPRNRPLRSKLDTFQLATGRTILGVTASSSSDGILGELGWMNDNMRGDLRSLLFFNRLLKLPAYTLPQQFFHSLLRHKQLNPLFSLPPFVEHCLHLCIIFNIDLALLGTAAWKPFVRKTLWNATALLWRQRIERQPRLQLIYPPSVAFGIQP